MAAAPLRGGLAANQGPQEAVPGAADTRYYVIGSLSYAAHTRARENGADALRDAPLERAGVEALLRSLQTSPSALLRVMRSADGSLTHPPLPGESAAAYDARLRTVVWPSAWRAAVVDRLREQHDLNPEVAPNPELDNGGDLLWTVQLKQLQRARRRDDGELTLKTAKERGSVLVDAILRVPPPLRAVLWRCCGPEWPGGPFAATRGGMAFVSARPSFWTPSAWEPPPGWALVGSPSVRAPDDPDSPPYPHDDLTDERGVTTRQFVFKRAPLEDELQAPPPLDAAAAPPVNAVFSNDVGTELDAPAAALVLDLRANGASPSAGVREARRKGCRAPKLPSTLPAALMLDVLPTETGLLGPWGSVRLGSFALRSPSAWDVRSTDGRVWLRRAAAAWVGAAAADAAAWDNAMAAAAVVPTPSPAQAAMVALGLLPPRTQLGRALQGALLRHGLLVVPLRDYLLEYGGTPARRAAVEDELRAALPTAPAATIAALCNPTSPLFSAESESPATAELGGFAGAWALVRPVQPPLHGGGVPPLAGVWWAQEWARSRTAAAVRLAVNVPASPDALTEAPRFAPSTWASSVWKPSAGGGPPSALLLRALGAVTSVRAAGAAPVTAVTLPVPRWALVALHAYALSELAGGPAPYTAVVAALDAAEEVDGAVRRLLPPLRVASALAAVGGLARAWAWKGLDGFDSLAVAQDPALQAERVVNSHYGVSTRDPEYAPLVAAARVFLCGVDAPLRTELLPGADAARAAARAGLARLPTATAARTAAWADLVDADAGDGRGLQTCFMAGPFPTPGRLAAMAAWAWVDEQAVAGGPAGDPPRPPPRPPMDDDVVVLEGDEPGGGGGGGGGGAQEDDPAGGGGGGPVQGGHARRSSSRATRAAAAVPPTSAAAPSPDGGRARPTRSASPPKVTRARSSIVWVRR